VQRLRRGTTRRSSTGPADDVVAAAASTPVARGSVQLRAAAASSAAELRFDGDLGGGFAARPLLRLRLGEMILSSGTRFHRRDERRAPTSNQTKSFIRCNAKIVIYFFQIKYSEAILSNITRKLLRFKIAV